MGTASLKQNTTCCAALRITGREKTRSLGGSPNIHPVDRSDRVYRIGRRCFPGRGPGLKSSISYEVGGSSFRIGGARSTTRYKLRQPPVGFVFSAADISVYISTAVAGHASNPGRPRALPEEGGTPRRGDGGGGGGRRARGAHEATAAQHAHRKASQPEPLTHAQS